MARAAYEANDTETGWACLNASRRMALHGYDDAERGDEARVLSIEIASKCGSWRAAALAALKLEENPTSPRLVLATLLRDDFSQNQWHKLERARIQLRRLTYGLIGAILAFIGLITYLGIPLGGKSEIPLVALALMGVIGGCVSAIQNLGKIAQDVKIPQQAADGFMAFTRPAVGAAAALAAVFLLQLGAISIGGQSNAALFAVCFAAGFSERLVVSGIERVTGK